MAEQDQLTEGFNAGYVLEKYRPELAQQISQAVETVEEEFFQGFVAGSEQYVKERTQSKTISKLKGTVMQIPRPTKKGKDNPGKGFEIDR